MKTTVKRSGNSQNYEALLEKIDILNKSVVTFQTIAPEDYERYAQMMHKNKILLMEVKQRCEQVERIQKRISLATSIGKAHLNIFRKVNTIISTLKSET